MYNMFTGAGFDMDAGGSFGLAWGGVVILFFIIMIGRKWLGENFDMGFNTLMAFGVSMVPYFIMITITGSIRWSFIIGLIGVIVGGIVVGFFWDTGGGDNYGY